MWDLFNCHINKGGVFNRRGALPLLFSSPGVPYFLFDEEEGEYGKKGRIVMGFDIGWRGRYSLTFFHGGLFHVLLFSYSTL